MVPPSVQGSPASPRLWRLGGEGGAARRGREPLDILRAVRYVGGAKEGWSCRGSMIGRRRLLSGIGELGGERVTGSR